MLIPLVYINVLTFIKHIITSSSKKAVGSDKGCKPTQSPFKIIPASGMA